MAVPGAAAVTVVTSPRSGTPAGPSSALAPAAAQFAVGDFVRERPGIEAAQTQPGERCVVVQVVPYADGSGYYYWLRLPTGTTDPYAVEEIEPTREQQLMCEARRLN